MDFTISIPDELLPALEAEFSLVQGSTAATTAEEYFIGSVVETVRQRAELYKVGPYYVGPVDPQFRQDGKPFGYVEPTLETDTELAPLDNDATLPDGGDV